MEATRVKTTVELNVEVATEYVDKDWQQTSCDLDYILSVNFSNNTH